MKELKVVNDWLATNKLYLTVRKTKCVPFTVKSFQDLVLVDKKYHESKTLKNLGVHIDNELKVLDHMHCLKKSYLKLLALRLNCDKLYLVIFAQIIQVLSETYFVIRYPCRWSYIHYTSLMCTDAKKTLANNVFQAINHEYRIRDDECICFACLNFPPKNSPNFLNFTPMNSSTFRNVRKEVSIDLSEQSSHKSKQQSLF